MGSDHSDGLVRGRAPWGVLRGSSARDPATVVLPVATGSGVFELEARCGSERVSARLGNGALVYDVVWHRRAKALVDAEATFMDATGVLRAASLEGPVEAVLVTIMRACDRISKVTIGTE